MVDRLPALSTRSARRLQTPSQVLDFRPLGHSDFPMLHEWLRRPHVAEWWPPPESYADVEEEFAPYVASDSATRGYIAVLDDIPLGFIQSYVVKDSGDGW